MNARKVEQDPPHIAAARAKLMDEVCAALPPGAAYRQTPMTDTPGTLEERLRRNSGWRNERHQCVTDPNLLTEAADEIARLYSLARANNDLARRYADEIASLRARVEAARRLLDNVGGFLDDFAQADLDEGAADAVTVGMVYQQQAQTVLLPRITQALKDTPDE